MTATKKIRPPIKRHGGKAYLARRIIALMPEHRCYFEPFVGGGSVLLNKPKAEVETAADLDAGLMGLWMALADPKKSPWVRWQADTTSYSEREFVRACEDEGSYPIGCPSQAAKYLVRSRFSRGGLGKTFAWSDRLRGGQPGDLNAWDTFRRVDLPAIVERIKNVTFVCGDALVMLRAYHSPDTLIYADPPYLHETRTARKAYDHEMTAAQHADLLSALVETPAKVMLSGYRSRMYDTSLSDWRRVDFDMPNHSGQGASKQRRKECLWMNFD